MFDFFATCPRNTEGLLAAELRSQGIADAAETRGGAAFSGPLSAGYRACLWSRVASRVLLRIASFPMLELEALYGGMRTIAWQDHLDVRGTLAVDVTSSVTRGPLARINTHYAEQNAKDAVVDEFREKMGSRPSVDLSQPSVRIRVHLAPAEATVYLDLSGEPLHKRGYRLDGVEAPLKENLAAATLLRAGWPAFSHEGRTLLDPMCGSGTLLIEGAFMAGDVAPGLLRSYYGFLGWKGFDSSAWTSLVDEAREKAASARDRIPPIIGFDSDPAAISAARRNARRAGLEGLIRAEVGQLADLQPPPGRGLVITNPPYGKRLGDVRELAGLYETLGQTLRTRFSGWTAAVFTGNPELSQHLGLRARRSNLFYNGPLLCRLLLFDIDPSAFGERRTPEKADALAFANRLRKNMRLIGRWAAREGVTCYRLYDADIPEFAVAVDRYEDWIHVQEYAPPRTVDPVQAAKRLRAALGVVAEVLNVPPERVVLKVRRRQKGAGQYAKFGDRRSFLEVGENGLRFLVNLFDYLDTGLFLDHRPTRTLIRRLASGRRFLNLFCYTGSATVYAAAGGALSTTSIDLSANYLQWAARNLELNGLNGPQHRFVRADCLEWLADSSTRAGKMARYDLILLDPPTFSNSKRMASELDVQRDHPALIRAAMELLAPGGVLLFSTNFRRFKLDPTLGDVFRVKDITRATIPPDFARNPRIHSCFEISR